jgi:hypothetical protein
LPAQGHTALLEQILRPVGLAQLDLEEEFAFLPAPSPTLNAVGVENGTNGIGPPSAIKRNKKGPGAKAGEGAEELSN